jgi:hypothetical protein
MNKDIDSIKNQYEEQIQQFKNVISKFDAEKSYLIEDLKSKHRIEIENLKLNFNSNKDTINADRLKLQEAHNIELLKIQAQVDEVKVKQVTEKNDHEQNIKKLKLLHEKEIEAMKTNTNSEFINQINSLQNEMEKLRKEKFENEKDLNKRYEEKLEEIVRKDEEIELLRAKLLNIKSNLENSGKDLTVINDELIKSRIESQKLKRQFNELENEINIYKERCDKQVQQLLEKSSISL